MVEQVFNIKGLEINYFIVPINRNQGNTKNLSYSIISQEEELTKAAKRLVFLSDYMQFTTAEMKLNTKTFQVIDFQLFNNHKENVNEKGEK